MQLFPFTAFYFALNELVDRYDVSISAMKTDLFNVLQFSFPLTPDLTFYKQLCGCFQKSRGRLAYRCTQLCFQFLVESELLICFVCVILVALCSLLYMYVFVRFPCFPWLVLSLDCILLITYYFGSLEYFEVKCLGNE